MREYPIFFNGPMVSAILKGRKTQTRRVMKVQPIPVEPDGWKTPSCEKKHDAPYFYAYCNRLKVESNPRGMSVNWCWWDEWDRQCLDQMIKCPFGVPGGRLWVRETLGNDGDSDWWYDADTEYLKMDYPSGWRVTHAHKKTIPSISMPRWACRIVLEVTSIRVERLQDISEEDALAEGVEWNGPGDSWNLPVDKFKSLWVSLYGLDSWSSNPWVWAVNFERVG